MTLLTDVTPWSPGRVPSCSSGGGSRTAELLAHVLWNSCSRIPTCHVSGRPLCAHCFWSPSLSQHPAGSLEALEAARALWHMGQYWGRQSGWNQNRALRADTWGTEKERPRTSESEPWASRHTWHKEWKNFRQSWHRVEGSFFQGHPGTRTRIGRSRSPAPAASQGHRGSWSARRIKRTAPVSGAQEASSIS